MGCLLKQWNEHLFSISMPLFFKFRRRTRFLSFIDASNFINLKKKSKKNFFRVIFDAFFKLNENAKSSARVSSPFDSPQFSTSMSTLIILFRGFSMRASNFFPAIFLKNRSHSISLKFTNYDMEY